MICISKHITNASWVHLIQRVINMEIKDKTIICDIRELRGLYKDLNRLVKFDLPFLNELRELIYKRLDGN